VAQDILNPAPRGARACVCIAEQARPIRSESRALLVASIARRRRWLHELMTDPKANTESIATREGCSVRKININFAGLSRA
jgi:hypothetical protein